MAFADPTRTESHIKHILNAVPTWGGSINSSGKAIYSDEAITKARIDSGMEILRAIASNPANSYFGSLATLVTVTHNSFLPAYDGEPGIPLIVPFSGAQAMEGIPATPDEIDSYRTDPTSSVYTGAYSGVRVAHDAADSSGQPSPISRRYSLVGGRFKFTGYSAQIPLIQLTRSMADTGVPENYEPTLVKLSIPKLVKEGDNLALIAPTYLQLGMQDLVAIKSGQWEVPPVPQIEFAQKAKVV